MRSYGTTNAAPYASAPAVGLAGDTYFNTTDKFLYLSDGTQWIVASGGGGSGSPAIVANGIALTDGVNSAVSVWQDWGTYATIPLTSFPIGSTDSIIAHITGWVYNFTDTNDVPALIRLGASFDGGTTWYFGNQNESNPYGQNSLFINRAMLSNSCTWVPPTGSTAAVRVKAQYQDGHGVGNSHFIQGQLQWWLTKGVKGDKGDPGIPGNLASANYAYLTVSSGPSLPAAQWTTLTWAAAAPPASFINNFTLAGSNQQIVCSETGRYRVLAQPFATVGGTVTNYFASQILHYNSVGGLITSHAINGTAGMAGSSTAAPQEVQFNMTAGDYIVVQVQANQTSTLDGRSTISITPVGGAKGDTGSVGPDITQQQSSYLFATTMGTWTTNTSWQGIAWQTVSGLINGFTLVGVNNVVNQAGRYRVAAQISGSASTASQWRQIRFAHYSSTDVLKANYDTVNYGAVTPTGIWGTWHGETILNCAVGDKIQIQLSSEFAIATDVSGRSWLEITPIGGVKGDTGPAGPSGSAVAVPPPYYSARASVAQAHPSANNGVQVALDTLIDTNSPSDYTLSSNYITVNSAGYYQIVGVAMAPASVSVTARYVVNITYWTGSQWSVGATGESAIGSSVASQPITAVWDTWLAAGTRISLWIISNDATKTWGVNAAATTVIPVMPSLTISKAGGAKGDQGIPGNSAGTTAWTALSLASGWSNFGSGWSPAQWRMAGDEMQLRGLIARSPITLGAFTIATFPVGQRPPNNVMFVCPAQGNLERTDMYSATGILQTTSAFITSVGDFGFFSLDNVRWSTIA